MKYTSTYTNKTNTRFWMVTGAMNAPRIRHATFADANAEAQRLATANPGTEFYVLEAIAGYKHEPSPLKKIL